MLLIALVDYAHCNDGAETVDVSFQSAEKATRCESMCKKSNALLEHVWLADYVQHMQIV